MNPHRLYFAAIDAGSFVATAIVILYAEEWISESQFEDWYGPAVWACLKIPYFVVFHEKWIGILGPIRTGLRRLFS